MNHPPRHPRASRAAKHRAARRCFTFRPSTIFRPSAAAIVLLSFAALLMPPAHAVAATGIDARALYLARCGICHLAGGTGTFMLGRRLGKQRALLADRTDLTAAYVEAVVRNGLNAMPAFTRVEITDRELAAVADYLAHRDGSAAASHRP